MNETIEIVTLQDIVDKVPDERFELFLTDLLMWLRTRDRLKQMAEQHHQDIAKELGIELTCEALNLDKMMWVDDGLVGNHMLEVEVIQDKGIRT